MGVSILLSTIAVFWTILPVSAQDEIPAETGWQHVINPKFHAEVGWPKVWKKEDPAKFIEWKKQLTKSITQKLTKDTNKGAFAGKVLVCHVTYGISKVGFLTHFKFEGTSDNKSFDSIIEKTFKSLSKDKKVPESSSKSAVNLLTYIEFSNGKYKIHHNVINHHPNRKPVNQFGPGFRF